jgi:hypothetical protein
MKTLHRILVLVALTLPLFVAVGLNQSKLEMERFNMERAPIKSSAFVSPNQALGYSFIATQDNLSEVELFMRPAEWGTYHDKYEVTITQTNNDDSRRVPVKASELWDDIATLSFEPFVESTDNQYRVTVKADAENTHPVQLATDVNDSSKFILQPYYQSETTYIAALGIVGDRLGWRLFPLILLLWASFHLLGQVRINRLF